MTIGRANFFKIMQALLIRAKYKTAILFIVPRGKHLKNSPFAPYVNGKAF